MLQGNPVANCLTGKQNKTPIPLLCHNVNSPTPRLIKSLQEIPLVLLLFSHNCGIVCIQLSLTVEFVKLLYEFYTKDESSCFRYCTVVVLIIIKQPKVLETSRNKLLLYTSLQQCIVNLYILVIILLYLSIKSMSVSFDILMVFSAISLIVGINWRRQNLGAFMASHQTQNVMKFLNILNCNPISTAIS